MGRGNDEVSPGSHLWSARNTELQSSLILRVLSPVPLVNEGERHVCHKTCSLGRPSRQSSGGRPTLGLAGAGPRTSFQVSPSWLWIFFNTCLNDDSSEVTYSTCSTTCWRSGRCAQRWLAGSRRSPLGFRRCCVPGSTEEECDFVAPVEFCFAAAFVGLLVPLLMLVFASPVAFDAISAGLY